MENKNQTQEQPAFFWKREITYGQFLGIIIAMLGTLGTIIWEQQTAITEYGIRISTIEKVQSQIPAALREIVIDNRDNNKDLQDKWQQILIQLNNKQDR